MTPATSRRELPSLLRTLLLRRRRTRLQLLSGGAALLFAFALLLLSRRRPPPSGGGRGGGGGAFSSRLAPPGGTSSSYRGIPWHNERTVSVETLGETKFARCDVHTVMSEDGTSLINDWIFLEETPAVNVIVQTLEGRFVVFRQRKYAIPGSTLSPVGGFVDPGESPFTAAKREVLEELGLGSRRTLRSVREKIKGYDNGRGGAPGKTLRVADVARIVAEGANPPAADAFGLPDGRPRQIPTLELDADWIFLGRYRTAANRGGGFLYSYLLKNAVPLVPGGGTVNYAGAGDDEAQEILYLSEEEVVEELSRGGFQEVKWAATFALAMLHLKAGMPACCSSKADE
ncbi:hypothetical protein ACHAWF_008061 [Thalassiosira exigua]